jgi:3-phosphoglycerate kinase
LVQKKTIESIDVTNKRVICRVDFNVPLDENNNITDDLRIKSSFATINYLLNKKASVILMSHLGRPKGVDEKLRLKPVFEYLKKNLQATVYYAQDCIGEEVKTLAKKLKPGEVLLLENLRFHKEEEKNDSNFAKELASLAEIYVNDAFGTAHRAHASTEGITKFLPAVAGYLMIKELDFLINAVENPKRPFTAIVGGKKVSDKILVLNRLLDICDNVLIGGGMTFTFLKAQNIDIGDSILDEKGLDLAKEILEKAKKMNKNLLLPLDIVAADDFSNDAEIKSVPADYGIPKGWQGLDIGFNTIKKFISVLKQSETILWNGPLGVFELDKFAKGTIEIAKYLASSGKTTIIGGGDTASAVENFGYGDKMTHISTGGGASLELLEGKELPGVAALNDL